MQYKASKELLDVVGMVQVGFPPFKSPFEFEEIEAPSAELSTCQCHNIPYLIIICRISCEDNTRFSNELAICRSTTP
jgi:hypothetical protein